jgi:pimeloyl-ACP methyl ester carboxylesterase
MTHDSRPLTLPLDDLFRHRQLDLDGLSIHVAEAGTAGQPAVFFLHGWPESWAAFQRVMATLSTDAHVIAIDLPGVGGSRTSPPWSDKRTLATYVRGVMEQLALQDVTLVGHDVGGMIVYAYLRASLGRVARAVIMNTAIPGVEPWPEVKRNPHIWHFGFHAVAGLPETLVAGHQSAYFDFFYDRLAADVAGVSVEQRETYVDAYARTSALRAGFDWYRAFDQDEHDNADAGRGRSDTPLLYLRGERDPGLGLEQYVSGLQAAGMTNVRGGVIKGSGHFAPDEQPERVAAAVREFMTK